MWQRDRRTGARRLEIHASDLDVPVRARRRQQLVELRARVGERAGLEGEHDGGGELHGTSVAGGGAAHNRGKRPQRSVARTDAPMHADVASSVASTVPPRTWTAVAPVAPHGGDDGERPAAREDLNERTLDTACSPPIDATSHSSIVNLNN
jgi:hypothetical protein